MHIIESLVNIRKYIAISSILISIAIFTYYIGRSILGIDPLYPFGENMVKYEIVIIPNLIYLKPVTLAIIIGYLGILTLLSHLTNYAIKNWSEHHFFILEVISGTLMFISGYEILFNFTLWNSLISSLAKNGEISDNIDLLYNIFPNPNNPWNLVFASKIFYFTFLSAITTFYYVNRWRSFKIK